MDPLVFAIRSVSITLLALSAFRLGFLFGRRDGVRKFERALLEFIDDS
jgi:hypothetical protein